MKQKPLNKTKLSDLQRVNTYYPDANRQSAADLLVAEYGSDATLEKIGKRLARPDAFTRELKPEFVPHLSAIQELSNLATLPGTLSPEDRKNLPFKV